MRTKNIWAFTVHVSFSYVLVHILSMWDVNWTSIVYVLQWQFAPIWNSRFPINQKNWLCEDRDLRLASAGVQDAAWPFFFYNTCTSKRERITLRRDPIGYKLGRGKVVMLYAHVYSTCVNKDTKSLSSFLAVWSHLISPFQRIPL